MPTPRLNLPRKRLSKVFDKVAALVKAAGNPSIKVLTYEQCSPNVDTAPTLGELPVIKLYPSNGPSDFYTPSDQTTPLFITADIYVAGKDPRNLMDVFETAIAHGLYASDQARWDLQALGAETGLSKFTGLQYDLFPKPDTTAVLKGTTQIFLNVRLGLDG